VILVIVAGILIAERIFRKFYTRYNQNVPVVGTVPVPQETPTKASTTLPPQQYNVQAQEKQVDDEGAAPNATGALVPPEEDANPNYGDAALTGTAEEQENLTVDNIRALAKPLYLSVDEEDTEGMDLRMRGQLEVLNAARALVAANLPNISDRTGGATKQTSGTRRLFNDPLAKSKRDMPVAVSLPPQPNRDFFHVRDQSNRDAEAARFGADATNATYRHPAPHLTAFATGDEMTEHARITTATRPGMYPRQSERVPAAPPRVPRASRLDDLQKPNFHEPETVFRPETHIKPYITPQTTAQFDRGARVVHPTISGPNDRRGNSDPVGHFALNSQSTTSRVSADEKPVPVSAAESLPVIGRNIAINNVVRESADFGRDMAHIRLRNPPTMPDFFVGNTSVNVAALGGGTGPLGATASTFSKQRTLTGVSQSVELPSRIIEKPRLNPEARQSTSFLQSGTLRDTGTTPNSINLTEPKTRGIVKMETEQETRTISARPDDLSRMSTFSFKPFSDSYQTDPYNQRREMDLPLSPRAPVIDRKELFETNRVPAGEMTSLRATRK
jgi:hypothetical protein